MGRKERKETKETQKSGTIRQGKKEGLTVLSCDYPGMVTGQQYEDNGWIMGLTKLSQTNSRLT
jgi:hypothetical protein